MTNRLIIFEDAKFADFFPLTLSRPVFALRCGMYQLWEKIARGFDGYKIAFSCRPELAAILKNDTGGEVNRIDYETGDRLIFINGRLRLGDKLTEALKTATENRIYHQDHITAAVVITEPLQHTPADEIRFTGEGAAEALGVKADIIAGEFEFYNFLWDLINLNEDEIKIDYQNSFARIDFSRMLDEARIDSAARILSEDDFYIAPGAEIGAGVVIDNRSGPVIIDRQAIVGPLSYIEGPCYIGPDTRIFRGNIRGGCSFGPHCRVGGEVEESIFQGYTNKYHDGFMGHAYLGSWVNLGAMTTNSDLKNNYSNITVRVNGRDIDTGLMKVGSFIGDHSKTGIGTLINTGVSIGFSCNIYGGTLVTSREVLSFSWGDERGYDIYRLDKAIEVARASTARRNHQLTANEERLFEIIFEQTTAER
jgi:UDP-N-acetylglucosamine diphosphorylase/glucosamine-1-phosphate N-acetyltransferase